MLSIAEEKHRAKTNFLAMTDNDGGIVVSLFLMAGAILYAMLSAVSYYEKNSKKGGAARLPRLCSGWANMGNSIVHVLLVAYMLSNSDNQSEYWVKERKLGGIEGPVFLALLNFAAGYFALQGWRMTFSIGWNAFVAVTGTFLPVVWPRFLAEGFRMWPYTIVFIWFAIFAFELTAFVASMTHFALGSAATTKNKE